MATLREAMNRERAWDQVWERRDQSRSELLGLMLALNGFADLIERELHTEPATPKKARWWAPWRRT